MTSLDHWLDELGSSAKTASSAEQSYRNDFARRVAELAEARAVAFRRVNLIKAVAESVSRVEDEQAAAAHGLAVFRTRLGWSQDSEARSEILSRFAPVCEAMFRASASASPRADALVEDEPGGTPVRPASVAADLRPGPRDEEAGDPAAALAAFESWYLDAKGTPFWKLFENVMPETPLVDW